MKNKIKKEVKKDWWKYFLGIAIIVLLLKEIQLHHKVLILQSDSIQLPRKWMEVVVEK